MFCSPLSSRAVPLAVSVLVCSLRLSAAGDEVRSARPHEGSGPPHEPRMVADRMRSPLIELDGLPIEPWLSLGSASETEPERVNELIHWNATRRSPLQNGFSRRIDRLHAIELRRADLTYQARRYAEGVAQLGPGGDAIWQALVSVRGAHALRLRLTTDLPVDAAVAVRSLPDGVWERLEFAGNSSWTPSLAGETVALRVVLPEGWARAAIQIDEVVELFELETDATARGASRAAGCTLDLSCASSDDALLLASRAVGRMVFSSGASSYVCSGGLIADAEGSDIPYFLTAHHCISSEPEAHSLEVTWDYRTTSCGGFSVNPSLLPHSVGATVLTTRSESDYTLLRLTSIPSGRSFLGWTTASPGASVLRRISHPAGGPQSYSETLAATTVGTICSDAPRSWYLYEDPWLAGIAGGSSGSPVWIDAGLVVGQLSGTCGGADCNPSTDTLDGRFARGFSFMQPWLDPAAGPAAPIQLRSTFVGRKKVVLTWTDTASDETRFDLWASTRDRSPVLVGTAGPNSSQLEVRGLKRATFYTFTLQACRDTGCSVPAALSLRTKR